MEEKQKKVTRGKMKYIKIRNQKKNIRNKGKNRKEENDDGRIQRREK